MPEGKQTKFQLVYGRWLASVAAQHNEMFASVTVFRSSTFGQLQFHVQCTLYMYKCSILDLMYNCKFFAP